MERMTADGECRYCDTWKAMSDVFGELEADNILPKTHK
jgi:hypothetical protein